MGFSDDYASPAAPFSGDNTGEIFDAPDMVLQSPTTNERVVDTQSGFLVVVKRMEDRLALLVRRRLGTPPSSQIVLTPDESTKLSRILAGVPGRPAGEAPASAPHVDAQASIDSLLAFRADSRPAGNPVRRSHVLMAAAAAFVLLLGATFGYIVGGGGAEKRPVAAVADPMASAAVDQFARRFVANMLDFNPSTYRVSQVRAMAAMAPELVEKYWLDTNFPLSLRQLKALPQGTTVMITRVNQQRLSPTRATVSIFAQMVNPGDKVGQPVHLELTVALDADGQVRVYEQKDVSVAAR